MVGGQDGHALPDRLPGQRVEDVGFQQVQGQALLVQPGIQQTGQHVGPVRGHGGATDAGVKHPPNTGDGPLHPDSSGHRGDQVALPTNDAASPSRSATAADPGGGVGELAGRDRVLTDHRELGVAVPARWSRCPRASTQGATAGRTGG